MEFEKYHKIRILGDDENKDIFFYKNDDIIVQEKMDGANFRFYINDNGQIIFGSRTQQLTSNEGEDTNVQRNFQIALNLIREKLRDKDLSKYKNMIFYGECMVSHTISYDWENIPTYLGFDIKYFKNDETIYLNFDNIKKIFGELDLAMVPLIKICKAKEITKVDDSIVPETKYPNISSTNKLAEGVVFKNYKRQIFAKYVREIFKEKSREVFGNSPKFAKTDDEFIVAKYCTNARIEKMIFKLSDEGHNIDMTITGDLIKRTIKDMFEEEWQDILMGNFKINSKGIRQLIAKRCLSILKQVIVNNSLEVKK